MKYLPNPATGSPAIAGCHFEGFLPSLGGKLLNPGTSLPAVRVSSGMEEFFFTTSSLPDKMRV